MYSNWFILLEQPQQFCYLLREWSLFTRHFFDLKLAVINFQEIRRSFFNRNFLDGKGRIDLEVSN